MVWIWQICDLVCVKGYLVIFFIIVYYFGEVDKLLWLKKVIGMVVLIEGMWLVEIDVVIGIQL